MKVYIVGSPNYDNGFDIATLFSTPEAAEQFKAAVDPSLEIQEWDMDAALSDLQQGRLLFEVRWESHNLTHFDEQMPMWAMFRGLADNALLLAEEEVTNPITVFPRLGGSRTVSVLVRAANADDAKVKAREKFLADRALVTKSA